MDKMLKPILGLNFHHKLKMKNKILTKIEDGIFICRQRKLSLGSSVQLKILMIITSEVGVLNDCE
jgi:hypothetical protein